MTRYPQQPIASVRERVQTYRYLAVLACGHLKTFTLSAKQRGKFQKRYGCHFCAAGINNDAQARLTRWSKGEDI